MQNSNPSRNPFSYPSLLQQLLESTFFGARPATASPAPTPDDVPGADAAQGDDHPDEDNGDPVDTAGRLELAELLGVLRDPIAWVFTLVERRTQGDPVDIAAIHRVRDAVLERVDQTIVGTPSAESLRIRSADLLTLGGLLFETLDPSLVLRVMQSVGSRIADAFAAGLQVVPLLAAHLARAAAPNTGQDVSPPVMPSWYGSIPVHSGAPYGYGAPFPYGSAPYGGPCVGSFAAPQVPRPVVPPWYWPPSAFAF